MVLFNATFNRRTSRFTFEGRYNTTVSRDLTAVAGQSQMCRIEIMVVNVQVVVIIVTFQVLKKKNQIKNRFLEKISRYSLNARNYKYKQSIVP